MHPPVSCDSEYIRRVALMRLDTTNVCVEQALVQGMHSSLRIAKFEDLSRPRDYKYAIMDKRDANKSSANARESRRAKQCRALLPNAAAVLTRPKRNELNVLISARDNEKTIVRAELEIDNTSRHEIFHLNYAAPYRVYEESSSIVCTD